MDFAEDKPAGVPCRHLDRAFACTIHGALRDRGFRGCTTFDCFGAGQVVSQRLFGGMSWRDRPETRAQMFSVFATVKQVHEMIWHLLEAQERTYDPGTAREAADLADSLASVVAGGLHGVLSLETDVVREAVRTVLTNVSAEVRSAYFADAGDLDPRLRPGADLAGCDLRGLRLCGADLRGAVLIGADLAECDLTAVDLLGADLRDTRVAGADLSSPLYLTQAQVESARGSGTTRLPQVLSSPAHWCTSPR
ncbi:pentapeptide repeat-containing protein [Rhodococcus gannanensis]|uniref:Pentapeptide repeat-containing protein n=1 Tax=Rhodococcus gannanensis TaxID=1960308 RepID=A0ABW4P6G6_9NOCA